MGFLFVSKADLPNLNLLLLGGNSLEGMELSECSVELRDLMALNLFNMGDSAFQYARKVEMGSSVIHFSLE